jgi:predicted dehydrogenase
MESTYRAATPHTTPGNPGAGVQRGQLRFVVIGLGGYGLVHIDAVKWLESKGLGVLSGVVALPVDRAQKPGLVESLRERNVALYENVDHFFTAGLETADVLTVPVGISMHVPISIRALRAGLHVYCEKPVAATVPEVDRLMAAGSESGRLVAIGFQHITSNSMQQLKARICDGRLGRAVSILLMCGWPRSVQYYTRNEWAGRLRLGNDWILDSPANNAHAHYLLNTLYLSSTGRDTTGTPVALQAELYRANPIESADTVQVRLKTEQGTLVFVTLSHANEKPTGPFMEIECENGRATWRSDEGKTVVTYRDGAREEFDNCTHDKWRFDGFSDLVEAILDHRPPRCTPAIARPQTVAIHAMHALSPPIVPIPEEHITETEDWEMFPPDTKGRFRRVRGMDEHLKAALDEGKFFSELGVPWATSVRSVMRPVPPVPRELSVNQ